MKEAKGTDKPEKEQEVSEIRREGWSSRWSEHEKCDVDIGMGGGGMRGVTMS